MGRLGLPAKRESEASHVATEFANSLHCDSDPDKAERMRWAAVTGEGPEDWRVNVSTENRLGRILPEVTPIEFPSLREYADHVVETVREPLVILDAHLLVRAVNHSFCRTFQVALEETKERFIYDLGEGQWDIPDLRRLLEEILPKNNPFHDFEVTHDFEHIGRKTMLLNARRVDRDGEPQMILLAIEDITEMKRAEQALEQTAAELTHSNEHLQQVAADLEQMSLARQQVYRELERAYESLKQAEARLVQSEKLTALGQLVAGVAHEINNPLAFVMNNIAVLRREVGQILHHFRLHQEAEATLAEHEPGLLARIREHAEANDLAYMQENLEELIVRSGEGLRRIQQIVKDLRNFAQQDDSKMREEDLNDGVASTANIIGGRAKAQGMELEVDLGLLPLVTCYPGKINQVVLNLLTNAIDACPAGGKVTVRTRPVPNGVEIHVLDTGCGIAPAIREKIFDPFFTTKPVGQGTGLGLSISYGIIRAHGGTIEVDSAPGQGAHFIVRLPLRPPAPNASSRPEVAAVPPV
jgi:PAS domain S-box-containing protein